MTSSNRLLSIYITFGHQKIFTEISNPDVKMNDICDCIETLFGTSLSKPYDIKIYNAEKKDFINLNQNELDHGYNPFKLYFSADDQDLESILSFVDLYVTKSSSANCETNIQTSSLCQDITLIDPNDSDEQESEQDLPLNNSTTNNNILDWNDLFNGLLLGHLKSLFDNTQANTDLFVNNNPVDNHPGIEASAENVVLLQKNLSITIENANICQGLAELTEVQTVESNRLYFSLDVKPKQKAIYKSDRFNQKDKTKTNGHITRIQGIKTGKPAKSSVLPRIHIPKQYRNKPIWLDTYVVSEKSQGERRHWIKHRDKGFLPKKCTNATSPINPISFALNENPLTNEGDLKLTLRMTTMWNKSELLEEVVYQLDEHEAIDLYGAAYDPLSPRLLCVLRKNNSPSMWETACLSDYIRSTKTRKRGLTNTNTNALNNAPTCKKARTK